MHPEREGFESKEMSTVLSTCARCKESFGKVAKEECPSNFCQHFDETGSVRTQCKHKDHCLCKGYLSRYGKGVSKKKMEKKRLFPYKAISTNTTEDLFFSGPKTNLSYLIFINAK